jgi:hypothetical protein
MTIRMVGLAVEEARRMLSENGYHCDVEVSDLVKWFEADTVYDQDFGLDKVIGVPLLVVHELVEIDNVKRMGLALTKDVILKNQEAVDTAHIRATEVEMQVALSVGDLDHVRSRLRDLTSWVEDPSVTAEHRKELESLRASVSAALEREREE